MKHFEITFSELHAILLEARYSLKKEVKHYEGIYDDDVINKDKQRISMINELEQFIMKCSSEFFKIVEDNPF